MDVITDELLASLQMEHTFNVIKKWQSLLASKFGFSAHINMNCNHLLQVADLLTDLQNKHYGTTSNLLQ